MAKYLKFQFLNMSPTGKTKIWEVVTVGDGPVILGSVKWFGKWRKYGFFPENDTVFETTCLRDIAEFCEEETKRHRKTA